MMISPALSAAAACHLQQQDGPSSFKPPPDWALTPLTEGLQITDWPLRDAAPPAPLFQTQLNFDGSVTLTIN